VDKKSHKIICTSFCNGKRHDFRLFKESKTYIHPDTDVLVDTGYLGIKKSMLDLSFPKRRRRRSL